MRREPWLVLLVVAMACLMSVYCVVRYANFGAGLDLSLFDQAIWHYSRFEAPLSTIKGFSLLGDHFHPTVALLAPLYWVWSDPRLLLIGASVLVSLSTIPVFLFARSRLDRPAAYLIAIAYAVFWGLQIGVGYEFHEVELGPLLIGLAILLADRRRWGWFYLVIALTLGVKEDLSIFVAFFGVYLLTLRDWRRGSALIVVGLAWYVLATKFAIPHFSPVRRYSYWTYSELGGNLPDALFAVVKAPWRIFTIGLSPGVKAHTLLYLFAPFLFLSFFSRWFILALPLLAERFLSTRTALWDTNLDYSLTIAPVLAMSACAGLVNVQHWLAPRFRISPRIAAAAMAAVSLGLTLSLQASPSRQLMRSAFYRSPWFKGPAEQAIAHVPAGAPVTANDAILTHVSHRQFASEITGTRGLKGYLIADLGEPVGEPIGNNDSFAELGRVLTSELAQTTPVYYHDDWLVAKLPPAGQRPSNGVLTPMPLQIARRLYGLWLAWHQAFQRGEIAAFDCYRSWRQTTGAAAACTSVAYAGLKQTQSKLLATVREAVTATTGPCASLGAQAVAAVAHAGDQLLALGALGQQRNMAAFRSTAARLNINVNFRDLPGRLDRYVVLCYPRNRAH